MNEQDLINKRMAKARRVRMKKLADKGKTTYLNKKWLFTKSCIERLSLSEIAALCGVEYDVIWYALQKAGLPIIIMIASEEWYDWIEKNKGKILAMKS